MNLSAVRNGAFVLAMTVLLQGAASDANALADEVLLDRLESTPWATVVTDQAGYRLRLLTEEQKTDAEKTISDYRESRNQDARDDQLLEAYRSLPADLRADRFYSVQRYGSDALELRKDDMRAILPLTSIRVFLIGPRGTFSSGGPFDRRATTRSTRPSPEEFIQALRGGRGASGGRSGVASGGGAVAGLLGGVVATAENHPQEPPFEVLPTVFYLKYAKSDSIADVIDNILSESDLRVAIEPRLNAIIVQCDTKTTEQVGRLVEALDKETAHGPKKPEEEPTLKTFSLDGADAEIVMNVLQTLLRGMPDVRISVDPTTNRLIALGRKANHETIKNTIAELAPKKD